MKTSRSTPSGKRAKSVVDDRIDDHYTESTSRALASRLSDRPDLRGCLVVIEGLALSMLANAGASP
jgi:hypothetical protein